MVTGIILTYKSKRAQDITKLNNELFGRVVTINRKGINYYYYYSGLFQGVLIKKLTSGCYFVTMTREFYDSSEVFNVYKDALLTFFVNDMVFEDELGTPEDHFREYHKGHEVANLG